MRQFQIKNYGNRSEVLDGPSVMYLGSYEGAVAWVDSHEVVGSVDGVPVTRNDFSEAFTKVQNKENWKLPINTIIPIDEAALTIKAVEFFTGSKATLINISAPGLVRIVAPGYYVACGS